MRPAWRLRNNDSSDGVRRQNTGSFKTGCPFKLVGREQVKLAQQWKLKVVHGLHTCPVQDPGGLPTSRRLTSEQLQCVQQSAEAGIDNKAVKDLLRQDDPAFLATTKDISNIRQRMLAELVVERTTTEVLLDLLHEKGYHVKFERSAEGSLLRLFFAHPETLAIAKVHPYVFLADCTYKTNRFHMPLLNIVGVNSDGMTFNAAFAWLKIRA